METFTNTGNFNQLAYAFWTPLCVYLLLPVFIWALIKRRFTYVTVLSWVTGYGVGFVPVGPLSFAKLSFGLSLVVLALQAFLVLRAYLGQHSSARKPWPPFTKAILVMLLLISVKAGLDTMVLGLDQFRQSAWKRTFLVVFIPNALLVGSFLLQSKREMVEDFFRAYLLLFGIWLVTGLAATFQHDPASLFFVGDLRLQLHNNDTINTVRPIPMFMICMCWLVITSPRGTWRTVGYVGMLASLVIVILSGTRQVGLSCALIMLLFLLILGQGRWAMALLIISACAYIPFSLLKTGSLFSRIETDGVTDYGRLEIWSNAYDSVLQSPFVGLGFREWGLIYRDWNYADGLAIDNKDTAHGLFQDITVDHGFIIGGAFFICYLLAVGAALFKMTHSGDSLRKIGALAFVGISISYFFSGAYMSCDGFLQTLLLYVFCCLVAPAATSPGLVSLGDLPPRGLRPVRRWQEPSPV